MFLSGETPADVMTGILRSLSSLVTSRYHAYVLSMEDSLHNPALPENLYVADATILPKAMGNPPILTIMALAKKIAALV